MLGHSTAMQEVQRLIEHVARTDASVLILGESGTGKEVAARTIHQLSDRADHPFVAINCGAIPADLLESELFGHEKGAFTGAVACRHGRFELAEGGTLFLDEIGDMPLPMQVKLLRVLQERCFQRVGGHETINTNTRIIAATHQKIEQRVEEGAFRLDLYYRLNVFPIHLPPLRERRGDISVLAGEFVKRLVLKHYQPIVLTDEALAVLECHEFRGNVRELENLIERLAILYPGETIHAAQLPEKYRARFDPAPVPVQVALAPATPDPGEEIDLKELLNNIEVSLIHKALENHDGVVAKAARALGLQRTTLVEKMRKLDIKKKAPLNVNNLTTA